MTNTPRFVSFQRYVDDAEILVNLNNLSYVADTRANGRVGLIVLHFVNSETITVRMSYSDFLRNILGVEEG